MTETLDPLVVDLEELRASVRAEYAAVATEPERRFHFHTGYRLAAILGYPQEWIESLPPGAALSMARTGRSAFWRESCSAPQAPPGRGSNGSSTAKI